MSNYKWGDNVKIKPLERFNGRIIESIENERGRQYLVRYFNNGEAKQSLFFPDELEKSPENCGGVVPGSEDAQ